MKRYSIILIATSVWLIFSCGGNKLKTNERALSKQILTEEGQLAKIAVEREEYEKQLADSIAKLPKGFRFKEDRKVDPVNPPMIIVISNPTNKGVKLCLSDIVNSIDYFVLEQFPDTSIYAKTQLRAKIDGTNIFIHGLSGLYVYDLKGKLKNTILENKISKMGVRIFSGGYQLRYEQDVNFYGQIGEIWCYGNHLFFTAHDKTNDLFDFRKVNFDKIFSPNLPLNSESHQIQFPGEKLFHLNKDQQCGGFSDRLNSVSYTRPVGEGFYMNFPSLWAATELGKDAVVINNNNDTICIFSNLNKIENFTKTLISRGGTCISTYDYKNQSYLYTALCDTIFRIVPPNRFIPVYVFDYGKYKISPLEYFSPGEPKNKYYCSEILETSNKLFIKYKGIEDHSEYGIYDKTSKEFFPISNSIQGSGITDDINGFHSYWPEYLNENNEDCRIYRVDQLKYAIKDRSLQSIKAKDRQKFEQFVNSLRDESLVAIIYKLKP